MNPLIFFKIEYINFFILNHRAKSESQRNHHHYAKTSKR